MKKKSKEDKEYCCPHCKVSIENWRDLYLSKLYVCGNEFCQKGFYLMKAVDSDFTSF
jgi:hypothetical protein